MQETHTNEVRRIRTHEMTHLIAALNGDWWGGGAGGVSWCIGRFRNTKEQRERKHPPFFYVREAERNITFSITGINVIKKKET